MLEIKSRHLTWGGPKSDDDFFGVLLQNLVGIPM